MSMTNPHRAVAAPTTAYDDAYAAMCVWEEMLAIKAKDDSEPDGLLKIRERVGRRTMREKAFELGKLANAVWAALDDVAHDMFAPFDWEFVPAFLRAIVFDSPALTLPRIETAVEDADESRRARGRAAREVRLEDRGGFVMAAPAWAASGAHLFLVAYEGADGKPYASIPRRRREGGLTWPRSR